MYEQALMQTKVVLEGLPSALSESEKNAVLRVIKSAFGMSDGELVELTTMGGEVILPKPEGQMVDTIAAERELWAMIPDDSLLGMYAEYTRYSEPPLAYHIFCALLAMGCVVNRRVWLDMIHFKIFPCLGVIILGPSGTKKTAAADIAVGMLQELQVTKIYSEKLTPEALIEAMKDMAQGLIYAPEMVTFINKQRYNDGLIPLITRFMDCPEHWASGTIMRGPKELHDIALSTLMCSTEDWFVNNTPEDTFGGGYFARHIIVEQDIPTRCIAIPRVTDEKLRQKILVQLAQLHEWVGPFVWAPDLREYFNEKWYGEVQKKGLGLEHPLLSTYYQRKPSHTLRVAMLLHLSTHRNQVLCMDCFKLADKLLGWTEGFLPLLIRRMFKTPEGQDADFVLRILRSMGGIIKHTELMQRAEHRMGAQRLRTVIATLKEGGRIIERTGKLNHVYILQEGGNGKLD